jgi:endo-1,4-beta-xylanase
MRCSLNLVLKAAAGIIPALFMGCSGSGSGLGPKAGASAAGAFATTGPSATGGVQPDAGGLGGAAAGGETGGAGTTVIAGTTTAGVSNPGGARTGASTSTIGTGGISGAGTTSLLGGSVLTATTSSTVGGRSTMSGGSTATGGTSNPGGGTVASSVTGGVTAPGGSRTSPIFPARFVGNIDTRGSILADFMKYWDQFTPENAGKWMAVQGGGKDSFNWKSLDAMYKYAEENNLIFKEHCFIWGSAQANWINNSNAIEAAKTWMKTFCDRYPKTRLIDVVNEPLHNTPGYAEGLRAGGTGYDWVANSFKFAREACPNAVLILNDYNNCEYANENKRIIDLVNTIKAQDAPIDAIGCQAHDAAKVKLATFKTYMEKITSETGLPIYVTEFDIGLADDEQQRAQYADYFTMFWDDPNVKGVTVWGYITGATWRANTGIMSSDGGMRTAMSWLMDFLKR